MNDPVHCVHAGFVHDAVLQWAYGVNKTLEQGFAPDDGFKITENIFNMQFDGITGTVAISDVGDRIMNLRYSLYFHLYSLVIPFT